MIKTVYWDDKDKRFMVIVKNGEHVRHHRVPRGIIDRAAADAYAEPLTSVFHHPVAP